MQPSFSEATHSMVLDLCLTSDSQHAHHMAKQLEDIYLTTFGLDYLVDDQKNTVLHSLAERPEFDQWDAILNGFVYLNATNAKSQTPLLIAIQNQNIQCVKKLIENGANPTIEDDRGINPIKYAIENNYAEALVELLKCAKAKVYVGKNIIRIAQMCIEKKALKCFEIFIKLLPTGFINITDAQGFSLIYHLVVAGAFDYIKVVCKLKSEVELRILVNKVEKSVAEFAPNAEIAELIILKLYHTDKGSLVNKKSSNQYIQEVIQKRQSLFDLHVAIQNGNINAINKAKVIDVVDEYGETPLIYAIELAIENGKKNIPFDTNIIDTLLNKSANPNLKEDKMPNNAFHVAAKGGRDDLLRKLLRVEPNLSIRDENNNHLVTCCIKGGNPLCLSAITERKPDFSEDTFIIQDELLSIDNPDKAGQMMDILLDAGFPLKVPTRRGKTLLREAIDKKSTKMVESLVKHDALKILENDDSYLIDVVVNEMNIADTFIAAGANPDIIHQGRPLIHETANHKYDKTRNDLLKGHENIKNSIDTNGNLFIHQACYYNNVYSIEDAIKVFNNPVSARNKFGETPIHLLMYQSSPDFEKNLKFLTDNGAKLIDFTQKQQNIFHIIAEHNNESAAKAIFSSGLLTNEIITNLIIRPDVEKKTPLEIACRSKDVGVAALFAKYIQIPIFNGPITLQNLNIYINGGFSLNIYNKAGIPLISVAILQYQQDNAGTIALVKAILDNGGDPSIPDLEINEKFEYKQPLSPIHYALLVGSVDLTRMLIDAGANFIVDPVVHVVAEDTKNEDLMALVKIPERRASAIQEIYVTQNNTYNIISGFLSKSENSLDLLGGNIKIEVYLYECKLMNRLLFMFVQRIKFIYDNLKPSSEIGNFLLYFADAFLPLLGMAANYDIAIAEMRGSPSLNSFLHQICFETLSIDDGLIVPTQQFTRYPDLIKAVIKVTPKEHPDTVFEQKALIKYSYIGKTSNDQQRIAESQKELRLVKLITNISDTIRDFTLNDILYFRGQFELKEFTPPSGQFDQYKNAPNLPNNSNFEWGLRTSTIQSPSGLPVKCFHTFGKSLDSFLGKSKISIFLFKNTTLFCVQKNADTYKLKFSCKTTEVIWDFGKEYGPENLKIYTPFGSLLLKCSPPKGTAANYERNRWRTDVEKTVAIDEANELSPGYEIVYASWVGEQSKCVHSQLIHVSCSNKTEAREKILKKLEDSVMKVLRKMSPLGVAVPMINYEFQTLKVNEGQQSIILSDIGFYN